MNIRKLPNIQIFAGCVSQVTPHCDAGQYTMLLAGFRFSAE